MVSVVVGPRRMDPGRPQRCAENSAPSVRGDTEVYVISDRRAFDPVHRFRADFAAALRLREFLEYFLLPQKITIPGDLAIFTLLTEWPAADVG